MPDVGLMNMPVASSSVMRPRPPTWSSFVIARLPVAAWPQADGVTASIARASTTTIPTAVCIACTSR
jgi:hypothetical protein